MGMIADFSSETMEAKKKWFNIFQVLWKELSTANSIFDKNILQKWRERETFSNEGKPREFIVGKHILKDWVKEVV